MSSKDSNETHTIYFKINNIKIVIGWKQIKLLKNFLNLLYKNIKKVLRKQLQEVNLFLIVLIYCTIMS